LEAPEAGRFAPLAEEEVSEVNLKVVLAVLGGTLAAAASLATAAIGAPGAGNGRDVIPYLCVSGPLAGQTIVVSVAPNDAPGASGFVDGTVYLLDSITVTVPGAGIVYQHESGERNGAGATSECTAQEGPATVDDFVSAAGGGA
jgi:hypothetical protein